MQTTRYWAQIGGWFFTLSALGGSTFLFYPDIISVDTSAFLLSSSAGTYGSCENTNVNFWGSVTGDTSGDTCNDYTSYPHWCGNYDDSDFISNSMCCICGGGTTGGGSIETTTEVPWTYIVGGTIVTLEIVGWVLFYIGYIDSIEYARYIIADQEEKAILDNFSINDNFDF